MKSRPILFSSPMVRALLAGTKVATRRVIPGNWWRCLDPEDPLDILKALPQCPFGVQGDELWVREALCRSEGRGKPVAQYASDGLFVVVKGPRGGLSNLAWPFKNGGVPPIHCPRIASRLTLDVTGTAIQRLHRITDTDAMQEGVKLGSAMNHRTAFQMLWDTLHSSEDTMWHANPWVWVVEFEVALP